MDGDELDLEVIKMLDHEAVERLNREILKHVRSEETSYREWVRERVDEVLKESAKRRLADIIRGAVDSALDRGDREAFDRLTVEYKKLLEA